VLCHFPNTIIIIPETLRERGRGEGCCDGPPYLRALGPIGPRYVIKIVVFTKNVVIFLGLISPRAVREGGVWRAVRERVKEYERGQ